MNPSVIVIGAGPGGLASAMLLASAGVKVKLLERMPIVGGRTSAIQTDGLKFDLGPTFFLYPRVLDEIFAAAGANLRHEVELVRLDPQYRIIFGGGGELNATPDITRMEQQIGVIAPEDAPGFRRFLEENRVKHDRMLPCLENPFLGWPDMLQPRLLRALPMLRPHQSVDTYLSRFFRDSRIRLAFSFQSKYLGMSPFRCPSLFSILSFLEYEYGVFHPIGGCAAVTAAMARVAERLGVEICLSQPVEQILFDGRRAVGVRTKEGVLPADALIMNADFARGISRSSSASLDRPQDRRKKFSCSTFMMYLGVEGSFDLPHHNIHISADYAQNLDEIENQHLLSDDPSFYAIYSEGIPAPDPTCYVCAPAITEAAVAPPGGEALYVLVHTPYLRPGHDWQRMLPRYRRIILDKLKRAAGMEDIESRIVFEQALTPEDIDRRYHVLKGAIYGLASHGRFFGAFKPSNRRPDVSGLYLAGGAAHPGPGVPMVLMSGWIAADALDKDVGLQRARKSPARAKQGVAQ